MAAVRHTESALLPELHRTGYLPLRPELLPVRHRHLRLLLLTSLGGRPPRGASLPHSRRSRLSGRFQAVLVRCTNCGTRFDLPPNAQPHNYMCSVCGNRFLQPVPSQTQPALIMSGAIGGAALGSAIGGPPGAIIGGAVGLVLGSLVK